VPNVSEFREAFGVRPACRRFGIAPDHCCPFKKRSKLHALQTLARPSLPLPETHLAFPLFSSLSGLNPFQKIFHSFGPFSPEISLYGMKQLIPNRTTKTFSPPDARSRAYAQSQNQKGTL